MTVDGPTHSEYYNRKTNLDDAASASPTGGSSQPEPRDTTAFRTDDYSTDCPTPVRITRRIEAVKSGKLLDWTIQKDCGQKGCPHCGPLLYRRHVQHFIAEFEYRQSLKFITLTIDRKIGLTRYDSRDYIVDAWAKFYDKLHYQCGKRDTSFVYMGAIEYDDEGFAHFHFVMSVPLPERLIRELWFKCGGGISCSVKPITSRLMLEDCIRYCLKNAFMMPWNDGPDDKGRRSIFNSTGIGYYSAEAKERRHRAARDKRSIGHSEEIEAKLREMGEYQEALADALSTAAGEDVVLPSGRTGVLLSWTPHQAHVLVEGKEKTFGPLEVEPVGFEPPLRFVETITPWSIKEREPALSEDERLEQQRRLEQLRMQARTAIYVHTRSDGTKERWSYDHETRAMKREVLGRSVGALDI